MRRLVIALLVLSSASLAYGAEMSISLDRCSILNSEADLQAEGKIALHFKTPEEVTGKEVIYAELCFSIPPLFLRADSLLEFNVFRLLSDWSENDITYENSESITDSLSAGSYTVKMGEVNDFRIDITPFLQDVAGGSRSNYGLVAIADLLGNANVRLSGNLRQPLLNQARVRIVYK